MSNLLCAQRDPDTANNVGLQEADEEEEVLSANTSVSSWCPSSLLFRRGSTTSAYGDAICFMEPGCQLIWKGEICVFRGGYWQVGRKQYSLERFQKSLSKASPDSLFVSLLLKAAKRGQTDFGDLHEFLTHPNYSRNFNGFLRKALEDWVGKPPEDIESEDFIALIDWKFEEDAPPDKEFEEEEEEDDADDEDRPRVRRVCLIVLVIGEADGKHCARLRHIPETWFHANHREWLLAWWKHLGGRDACLQKVSREQGLPMGDQFLVHALRDYRKSRGKRSYLVEFVGYDLEAATRQSRETIAPSLVKAYHEAHPIPRKKRRTY